MNWFHFILAFFGMYTTNDFSIEYIWKKRSVCIFETKCWFGWFFVHIPQKQSKDMVWNTFNFPFPQRIKLNQFRMQITKDYSEINLAFIKLWRLFFQIFLLNLQYILTCFLYNTWFFFSISRRSSWPVSRPPVCHQRTWQFRSCFICHLNQ